ncbi:similar to Saccharomyces cerevisiae YHR188C GPI16 Transmembrane protein subunit of the glycosylphosphatidylinositol transamidase complex that adds GPIs to newly synthesized proteins [Maudiozyma saulgeensis]|uniref:Similar to Saccharomyces cerevisiae YHR188C GPI16 Transmembrane protein subunit of the glycosylphosphatidylinositol transamidase complex that adds GPIs to newly synthesized proteins n=1 Tax=Maudiozyma saulgeensis TaxID=1789683 RepID=A0A1X7RAV0_9SACH|nr:similar to Saccharomyces cerevisiae YHR188C GPI16 Transmembrane protein subunit of the glycosylphosphatidylinositol transamidase complex that adds GPIs to newly synthesized proteins [Kazachstania saulgeensis]
MSNSITTFVLQGLLLITGLVIATDESLSNTETKDINDQKFRTIDTGIQFPYEERLNVRPLPHNHLLSSFEFQMNSEPFFPSDSSSNFDKYDHYTIFPKAIEPLLRRTDVRQLHLRFTRGFWDSEEWGRLPHDGFKSGGSGVELWALIEGNSKKDAYKKWKSLANSLSGSFCASINFIDLSKTNYPVFSFNPQERENEGIPLFNSTNNLYLMHASLANEPICTENLTPLLKLLPSKGKSGISSLLDGHKLFDSIWHNMAIDITTQCVNDDSYSNSGECFYEMEANVDVVAHIPSILARNKNPIPKPLGGDDLHCDLSKPYDAYQCFPSPETSEISFSLSDIFGKNISGSNDLSFTHSRICASISENWLATIKVDDGLFGTDDNCFDLTENRNYDIYMESGSSNKVARNDDVPIYVSRSLTGYGQDHGGLRTVFSNPTLEPVRLSYYESLPWFMRIYLSTLKMEVTSDIYQNLTFNDIVESQYYMPAIDRKRSTQLEFIMTIPANCTISLTYEFDKALLHFTEYPPDANHGFEIESLIITILESAPYQLRTATLLLYLSTPDFSMPYNVIIISSTIMGLIFGTLYNLITKRMVTMDEAEKILATRSIKYKVMMLKQRILSKLGF